MITEIKQREPYYRHWNDFDSIEKLSIEPVEFLKHWSVSYPQLARLAGCSVSTVSQWFSRGRFHREPKPVYKFRLALVHHRWLSLSNFKKSEY
jgi:DNA-binding transcriptional regulator YiaG